MDESPEIIYLVFADQINLLKNGISKSSLRNAIFRKKKTLKGKAVSTEENLTKKRISEMKVARETYGFKNVWSQDGKTLYTDANDSNKIKVFYD